MAEQANRIDTDLPPETEDDTEETQTGGVSTAEGGDGQGEAGRQGNTEAQNEDARAKMHEFEQQDELPSDLKQWPDGKAKFITIGDDEDVPYGEGSTEKLGPTVVHHDDGSVSADGEKVDNPEDFKGEPIPLAIEGMDAPEVSGQDAAERQR